MSNISYFNADMGHFLEDSSEMKPDVTYRIMEKDGMKLQGEVKAHKFVLGMSSPVFRMSFFGMENIDRNASTIDIYDTKVKPFQLMIDLIYNKTSASERLQQMKDGQEIFDLYYLAHKYELTKLEIILEDVASKLHVTRETLMDFATVALEFTHFPKISDALFSNCVKYLKGVLATSEDFVNFAAEYSGSGYEVVCLKLQAKMRELQTTNAQGFSPYAGAKFDY